MNNEKKKLKIEELKVFQDSEFLLKYIYKITQKYPKYEKNALVSDNKRQSFDITKNIVYAQKVENLENKINYLSIVDADLKTLLVLVRISYKNKYINSQNYSSWSKIIARIDNSITAWERRCFFMNKRKSEPYEIN